MIGKVDISSYLRPASGRDASDQACENSTGERPKHDPTYSAVFGWAFGEPKLLPPEPHSEAESR
jgi:hypothetical protein